MQWWLTDWSGLLDHFAYTLLATSIYTRQEKIQHEMSRTRRPGCGLLFALLDVH